LAHYEMPRSEDDPARRRRRAADTARWRSRRRRRVELYPVEVGWHELEFAMRFGGLTEAGISDRAAVSAALGKLLQRAILALVHEQDRKKA
jgi:hypothetical protein